MRWRGCFIEPGSPERIHVAINVPIGQWHSIRALESGTVVLAVKDGGCGALGEGDMLAL
jgi:hypothetical protein